eukprot:1413515-Amphidinium_carterae.1
MLRTPMLYPGVIPRTREASYHRYHAALKSTSLLCSGFAKGTRLTPVEQACTHCGIEKHDAAAQADMTATEKRPKRPEAAPSSCGTKSMFCSVTSTLPPEGATQDVHGSVGRNAGYQRVVEREVVATGDGARPATF